MSSAVRTSALRRGGGIILQLGLCRALSARANVQSQQSQPRADVYLHQPLSGSRRQSSSLGGVPLLAKSRTAEITMVESEPRVGGLWQRHVLVEIRHLHLQTNFVGRIIVDRNVVQSPIGRKQ